MDFQYSEKRLETLVENRTVYTLRHSELNIFETYKQAEKVELQFNEPILASMLRGKKIMHLRDKPGFGFYPGESIIESPTFGSSYFTVRDGGAITLTELPENALGVRCAGIVQ